MFNVRKLRSGSVDTPTGGCSHEQLHELQTDIVRQVIDAVSASQAAIIDEIQVSEYNACHVACAECYRFSVLEETG